MSKYPSYQGTKSKWILGKRTCVDQVATMSWSAKGKFVSVEMYHYELTPDEARALMELLREHGDIE